jgi:hypothetical protein
MVCQKTCSVEIESPMWQEHMCNLLFIMFGTVHESHEFDPYLSQKDIVGLCFILGTGVFPLRNATFAINQSQGSFWTGRPWNCHLSMIRCSIKKWMMLECIQFLSFLVYHPVYCVGICLQFSVCFWVREYVYLCACRCYWRKMMQVNRKLPIYCSEIMKQNSGT